MKKATLFILIIILSTCSKPVENLIDSLTVDNIDGRSLWTRITEEADYKSYSFWPGHEDIQPGQSPHGVYHKIYINKILAPSFSHSVFLELYISLHFSKSTIVSST